MYKRYYYLLLLNLYNCSNVLYKIEDNKIILDKSKVKDINELIYNPNKITMSNLNSNIYMLIQM